MPHFENRSRAVVMWKLLIKFRRSFRSHLQVCFSPWANNMNVQLSATRGGPLGSLINIQKPRRHHSRKCRRKYGQFSFRSFVECRVLHYLRLFNLLTAADKPTQTVDLNAHTCAETRTDGAHIGLNVFLFSFLMNKAQTASVKNANFTATPCKVQYSAGLTSVSRAARWCLARYAWRVLESFHLQVSLLITRHPLTSSLDVTWSSEITWTRIL